MQQRNAKSDVNLTPAQTWGVIARRDATLKRILSTKDARSRFLATWLRVRGLVPPVVL